MPQPLGPSMETKLAVLNLRVEVDDGAYIAIEGLVDVDKDNVEIGHGPASSTAGCRLDVHALFRQKNLPRLKRRSIAAKWP